ncbi:MAG TPA: hypothetical protein VGL57_11290 [Solirubrobacteraceae bacterium]
MSQLVAVVRIRRMLLWVAVMSGALMGFGAAAAANAFSTQDCEPNGCWSGTVTVTELGENEYYPDDVHFGGEELFEKVIGEWTFSLFTPEEYLSEMPGAPPPPPPTGTISLTAANGEACKRFLTVNQLQWTSTEHRILVEHNQDNTGYRVLTGWDVGVFGYGPETQVTEPLICDGNGLGFHFGDPSEHAVLSDAFGGSSDSIPFQPVGADPDHLVGTEYFQTGNVCVPATEARCEDSGSMTYDLHRCEIRPGGESPNCLAPTCQGEGLEGAYPSCHVCETPACLKEAEQREEEGIRRLEELDREEATKTKAFEEELAKENAAKTRTAKVEEEAKKHEEEQMVRLEISPGWGKVTSSPVGIDCPSKCEAYYRKGTRVTLSATTDGNHHQLGFTTVHGNVCVGSGSSCAVDLLLDEITLLRPLEPERWKLFSPGEKVDIAGYGADAAENGAVGCAVSAAILAGAAEAGFAEYGAKLTLDQFSESLGLKDWRTLAYFIGDTLVPGLGETANGLVLINEAQAEELEARVSKAFDFAFGNCAQGAAETVAAGILLVIDPRDPHGESVALPLKRKPLSEPRCKAPGAPQRHACAALHKAGRAYRSASERMASITEALAITANRFATAAKAAEEPEMKLQRAVTRVLDDEAARAFQASNQTSLRLARTLKSARVDVTFSPEQIRAGQEALRAPGALSTSQTAQLMARDVVNTPEELGEAIVAMEATAPTRAISLQEVLSQKMSTAGLQAGADKLRPAELKLIITALYRQHELSSAAKRLLSQSSNRSTLRRALPAVTQAASREFLATAIGLI